MVPSIHAKFGYSSFLSNVGVKRETNIVSQNGFQNGFGSSYSPTYLRHLSEGLVDYLNFILVLSSFYACHTTLKENLQQLMTIWCFDFEHMYVQIFFQLSWLMKLSSIKGVSLLTTLRFKCKALNSAKNFFCEEDRKLCIICFSGAMKKNAKRVHLQKVTDFSSYNQRALLSTKYLHVIVKCAKQ